MVIGLPVRHHGDMHELAVTRALLDVALGAAEGHRVRVIHVIMGALATMVDDAVQFYFDLLARGTSAEGAALHFHRPPAQGSCGRCGAVWEDRPPLREACPACGSGSVHVEGGREFLVDSIEVDHEDPGRDGHPEGQ